jgi:hypothetical protein
MEETNIIFKEKFTNKTFFKTFSDLSLVVIIVVDVLALILALTVLKSIWRERCSLFQHCL